MGVTACQDPHEAPGTAATPSRTAALAPSLRPRTMPGLPPPPPPRTPAPAC